MFWRRKIAPDDLQRLDALEERVARFERQQAALLEDVDEYFRKINKARQRVDAQERRDGSGAESFGDMNQPAEVRKAALRKLLRARTGA